MTTPANTDTARLDYLDSLIVPSGHGWRVRHSTRGKGWRLMTTTSPPWYPTAREASTRLSRKRATHEAQPTREAKA